MTHLPPKQDNFLIPSIYVHTTNALEGHWNH